MEAISTNEIRLANLKAVYAMRRAEAEVAYRKVSCAATKIIENAVAHSAITGYALRKDENGLVDFDIMELCGRNHRGEELVSISLYFRRRLRENESPNRVLMLGTSCFGNVTASDEKGIAYCLLLGYLAAHLQEIQDALNAIPDWEAYERARRFYDVSSRELMEFERKLADEAKTARRAEIEKRLVVGAWIAYAHETEWKEDGRVFTGVRTKVIEKVTAKLLFFKGDNRQYKKEEVLGLLSKGVNRCGWSFAADVDMTQFPCKVVR
jgi:hypothetical protein